MFSEKYITGSRSRREFRVAERLGEGASGIVYKAIATDSEAYALKLPNQTALNDRIDNAATLVREAAIQEQFSDRRITPVVLFDTASSGNPFLVMPLADNSLNSQRLMTPAESSVVSIQVAEALDVVHEKRFTHGDVKPDNVLLQRTPDGISAQLTDFGSALPFGAHENNPVLATELYAAPERFDGVNSPAVDQYAWAAGVVYPSFTGEAPSDPNEYDEILDIYGYPRSMETIIGAKNMTPTHDVFQEVAKSALKEFPSERYASMAELIDDLKMKLAKSDEVQKKNKKYFL